MSVIKKDPKEIEALSDFEYVLMKPTIFIGSIEPTEEKIPIVENNKIVYKDKVMSIGFYKLLNEIVDNAVDEAKRCNGKMKTITVEIFSKSGRVIVTDTGDGFYKGSEKNKTTGVSNVETAMSRLRAGSNFRNSDTNVKDHLVGTNGVGASVVNMLSDTFEIETCDGTKMYKQIWTQFSTSKKWLKPCNVKGTKVDFVLRKDKFESCVWDREILHSMFIYRQYNFSFDPILKNLEFIVKFNNEVLDLNVPLYDEQSVVVDSKIGRIVVTKKAQDSDRINFVNGQMCSGIQQKIIQEYINEWFQDEKAHEFYDTIISMNLEPKLVSFGDQNKTKFASTRAIIEPILDKNFKLKLKKALIGSELYNHVAKCIADRNAGASSKQLSKIAKNKKLDLSSKYFPPSKTYDMIMLCEGGSALGSINPKRDPKTMGTYALRGKLKKVKTVKDLTTSVQISELIQILGLDAKTKKCNYDKIVIATDYDYDGAHITALIINFLYTWFPYVFEQNRVYRLVTPLVIGISGKTTHRFYSMEEFNKFNKSLTNIKYVKGLGSLNPNDWDNVFKNLTLIKYEVDPDTDTMLNMAFSKEAKDRKDWLTL